MTAVLRSRFSNLEVAQRFGAFCKEHAVITRGFVKVGMTPRGLRGVVANKPIPVNENIIIVPDKAFITAWDALRNKSFVDGVCGGTFPLAPENINERILGGFMYVHQALLGYYLADILMLGDHVDSTAQSEAVAKAQQQFDITPGGGFVRYVDFMPRHEGNFSELRDIIQRTVRAWPVNAELEERFAKRHHLSDQDAREVIEWGIIMVISRALPVEHKPTLEKVLRDTPFTQLLNGEPDLTQYSLPVMAPLLDMVNHSTQNENVAVMVPDAPMREARPIVARSLRPIAQGEEILMRYGLTDPFGLRVFYGMESVLP